MIKKGVFGLVVCLTMLAVVPSTGVASVTPCNTNADCTNDDFFCNGIVVCVQSAPSTQSVCELNATPCGEGFVCSESLKDCVQCVSNNDCSGFDVCLVPMGICVGCINSGDCRNDNTHCNGAEICNAGYTCIHEGDPCLAFDKLCNETSDQCYARPQCTVATTCPEDNVFCNGVRSCTNGLCGNAGYPCGGDKPECDEVHDECVECLVADTCPDDQLWCTGDPRCTEGVCNETPPPCSGAKPECIEDNRICVECVDDTGCSGDTPYCVRNQCEECAVNADCADGVFCNGVERCTAGACINGTPPCGDRICDEDYTRCIECLANADCDNGVFCDGDETCVSGACVDGPGPCKAGETCDEQNEECIPAAVCKTDADCEGDGLFCNGIEVCVLSAAAETTPVEQGLCESPGNPCESGETCNEESNTCEVAIGGTMKIDRCTVKAGKTDSSDSIKFSGLLDADEADFSMGGVVVVIIEADAIPNLNATTFSFSVDEDSLKNGKYKSPKDKSDPVAFLQIDTNKGKFKFSAKHADLTGLGCPINITIQIGDYFAKFELGEDIVNGPKKPCPPELLE